MPLTGAAWLFQRYLDPTSPAPVVVAYSGGGDSLALLLAALEWARGCGRSVVAAHVDHGLQAQSPAWASQAATTARALGAGFELLQWSGPKPSVGLPAAARTVRLGLLADLARRLGACVVVLGHTADDAEEGEWMRGQGSSLGRLRTWSPSPVWPQGRGVFHFRPLLQSRRSKLRMELSRRTLQWIDDPANADPTYARSRARLALSAGDAAEPLPAFEGPGGADLSRLFVGMAINCDRFGVVSLHRTALTSAPADSARAVLGAALTCASGAQTPPRTRKIDGLLARLSGAGLVTATLAGARLEADPQLVRIGRDAGRLASDGGGADLICGEETVWDGRFGVQCREPGWRIAPAAGNMARLAPRLRQQLKAAAPAIRPTLPLGVKEGQALTCPILAHAAVKASSLAGPRLLAAMGLVQTESQAMGLAHGEDGAEDLSSAPKTYEG